MADRQVLPDLSSAEAALERGDYGQALSVLNPLANAHPLPGQAGAQIRLLMITAWMGQGDETSAIATCRLLSRCQQPEIRSQAKQLLTSGICSVGVTISIERQNISDRDTGTITSGSRGDDKRAVYEIDFNAVPLVSGLSNQIAGRDHST